ncbi:hypothetical protein STRAU_2113 [Streptomyces aurantiacus JA 4570]|uniref:Uncharacterized protein n=1 Tax=Streptomyces aurantiacus JA 4570 TaxID=1286094 RepID=S3ZNP2_9ACTN|nr:hypothetical protein STRAU_2113 [Streptomyces aurantiacus JA 4570]
MVGAVALAVALTAAPGAAAGPGDNGELVVSPGAVRPGEWVRLSVLNTELDDRNAVVESEAFAGTVKLESPGKVAWKGRAQVRCDAGPGTYAVRFTESIPPDDTYGGKVRVEAGGPAEGSGCAGKAGDEAGSDGVGGTIIGLATGACVAVAAGAFFVVRRGRRA